MGQGGAVVFEQLLPEIGLPDAVVEERPADLDQHMGEAGAADLLPAGTDGGEAVEAV